MTDTKPTMDEQIAFMSGLNALWKESMKDNSIQDSILASLEKLKGIYEAEMPVEPKVYQQQFFCDDGTIESHESVLKHDYDALKAYAQRKDAEAWDMAMKVNIAEEEKLEAQHEAREQREEVARLNQWADSFTDAHLKERKTGDALVKELQQRAESAEQANAALVAENESLRKDAERYRWLRSEGFDRPAQMWVTPLNDNVPIVHTDLDAAIDNAMKGGRE